VPPVDAIAIGCSTGGFGALKRLLGALDRRLRQAIIICSHTSADAPDMLAELLGRHSALPVTEARERCAARPGVVHVAPAGYHLLLEPDRRFALSIDPPVHFSRPSIDVLFDSAARAYRDALVGVLLTGASVDGAGGLADIRRHGGVAVVQDPDDAEAATMPRAALELAGADHCLPLAQIAPLLNHLCLP
jgi:two-component system chemotaxis response regulator CheB